MKIVFAGSAGGHLAQLLTLRPWWSQHQRIWVTFDTPDARSNLRGERVIWLRHSPERAPLDVVRSAFSAARQLPRLRPDLVVSAGASLGALYVAAARAAGVPSLYVEVFDRIATPSLSGLLCYRVADAFAVQWPEQLRLYPRASVVGPLL